MSSTGGTTFYLIRHGDDDLVGKAIAGREPGVHLNEKGHQQAEQLVDRLRSISIDHIYSSPLERARETAFPLAKERGLEVRVTPEIIELQFGEWTGKSFKELAADPHWQLWNRFRSEGRIPNGETMAALQSRFVDCLCQLWRRHPDSSIALFSHGDPIRSALYYYLGIPLDFVNRLEISTASVSILRLSETGPQVLCVNQTYEFDQID